MLFNKEHTYSLFLMAKKSLLQERLHGHCKPLLFPRRFEIGNERKLLQFGIEKRVRDCGSSLFFLLERSFMLKQ